MGSFYTPNLPYDINTFLDNLSAYSLSEEEATFLDVSREITDTQKYYFLGVPFPTVNNTPASAGLPFIFPGLFTNIGSQLVPPLSFLIAVSGDSYYATDEGRLPIPQKMTRSLEGFQYRIFDKGAKMDVMVNTQFAENYSAAGLMANVFAPNVQTNHPIGPMFLQTPYVVLKPGALQLEITNLSQRSCGIQIFLHFAVPVNRQSANENLILQGGNQR